MKTVLRTGVAPLTRHPPRGCDGWWRAPVVNHRQVTQLRATVSGEAQPRTPLVNLFSHRDFAPALVSVRRIQWRSIRMAVLLTMCRSTTRTAAAWAATAGRTRSAWARARRPSHRATHQWPDTTGRTDVNSGGESTPDFGAPCLADSPTSLAPALAWGQALASLDPALRGSGLALSLRAGLTSS